MRQLVNDHSSVQTNGIEIDENNIVDEIMTNSEEKKNNSNAKSQTFPTEFSMKILQDSSVICESIFLLLFDGLSWPDTSSITKMLNISQLLIKHLPTLVVSKPEFLRQLYIFILCALKTHGDNEPIVCNLLSLAISTYETFHQTSTNLFENVLMEIPGVTEQQVKNYRDKMQRQTIGKPLNDKEKRDLLKHLVQPLMGLNVAQMFRREPLALTNLPPLIRFSKRSNHPVAVQQDEITEDQGLADLFQHSSEN